ncbi:hypothetical protein DFJ73DRAFT_812285 [Zopfochytrium polystomum]|nr:hypothetical protein DFJ73DRAFT_812285 [Zopfochytrium polystomum]
MSQEFASALTRFYPTDPPMPALTNPLIASYEGENEPDHYGNPDIYTKYYHMPKWIISSSMVVSVRSLAQNPLQDPESKLSRTFVIETQHREYILRAPTAAEFRRWTFLLSRMSAHGGDRPMHLDDRHLQDPSFLLQTEDDEEVINDQPDADDDDMFDFPDQKQLAGVYESQVQEEQSLEQKHSSLARMGAWRRSVADLIQSDVEARNSVLSVTNTSEGKATVERGLGSHSLASNNGPGPQASQGHSQFEHQQPYQPGLPFDAGPRPLPPGRMPVPIKPGELKAPDGRIMRGPTIFGAAIAAGVHPTTMILPGAPNMQPARDDSAMMPLQPPGQGQGSREVSPYGVKLSEDQPREAAPEVNEPPPAGPLPPPLPAFKLQANDFKDFFGADDDDEDDEPKPSSQKQEPPKKGGFKFPFTGGHRRSLSKRKKENRMSILSESGQAIPAVYQPKQTRKSGLSRSDPPAPQLQRKNTLTRSDSTGMQQNSFPMPTGSSQGLLQTFADMNLGPAQGNQKIPPGVFPPGALPPQMQNQAPPGFPPFPQQAGMNFPNAIPLPAPLPHFPPHAAKQKLPPFDPSTIEDVIHASNGISRVIRRLQGQDRDADGTDQTRKPVFPSDDHIAHFVAISIPHLIGRILRAIDERVGQLQDAGITGIGTGFPEMRRDLVGCGEEWEVRVVRSIMSAPPSVGAKRMLWTRIFEDVGSNVAPLCGRLVAVSGSARSLFA